jgi:hypothetical protein
MAGTQCSNYDSKTTAVKLCRHLDLTFFGVHAQAVSHTLVAKLTHRVPAYCGVQRRALSDWVMVVGKFISNGFTAMLEHSINQHADTLTKTAINQPHPKST